MKYLGIELLRHMAEQQSFRNTLFSDMLKEEYLWSEEYDDEEDEMRYEEDDVFPDDLFYSFYYYAYQALLPCKPILLLLENTALVKKAHELNELL